MAPKTVKTLAAFFVVTEQRWDGQHYPYEETVSMWDDHLKAYEALRTSFGKKEKMSIILRHINVLENGAVMNVNHKVLYTNNEWVSPEHDPRAADPQFREYLRLKEIYESPDKN